MGPGNNGIYFENAIILISVLGTKQGRLAGGNLEMNVAVSGNFQQQQSKLESTNPEAQGEPSTACVRARAAGGVGGGWGRGRRGASLRGAASLDCRPSNRIGWCCGGLVGMWLALWWGRTAKRRWAGDMAPHGYARDCGGVRWCVPGGVVCASHSSGELGEIMREVESRKGFSH